MDLELLPFVFALVGPALFLVWWAIARWRGRRDVWVPMHDAAYFNRGDVVSLGAPPPKRFRILLVTRRSVKVRPL